MITTSASATGQNAFVAASPSPYHVCATAAAELSAAGFVELEETADWPRADGDYFTRRGGSIIAWRQRAGLPGFRIVGGHTDSPNLRVKAHSAGVVTGLRTVALEPYGGAWLPTWLDRDLGVSGRLAVRDGAGVRQVQVLLDEPLLRVPSLAIHLAAERDTPPLNPQRHLDAIFSFDSDFLGFVAARYDVDPAAVLGFDLMVHDVTPPGLLGAAEEFVSSPRLDNQGTCYAGLRALLDVDVTTAQPLLALFDHEEVGSSSASGAGSDFLISTLERVVAADSRADFLRAVANSVVASGDMAHATHPTHAERHEPLHHIELGGGPVLKINQNLRYASDAESEAIFALACAQAEVPLQRYVHRADLRCGSTIGPITATRTGIRTVDVGAPQLSMHSAREFMAASDVPTYSAALQAFLAPQR